MTDESTTKKIANLLMIIGIIVTAAKEIIELSDNR